MLVLIPFHYAKVFGWMISLFMAISDIIAVDAAMLLC